MNDDTTARWSLIALTAFVSNAAINRLAQPTSLPSQKQTVD